MKYRLTSWLIVTHRWLGVAMCLLFALWFSTGIIMMYVEYPELTESERLADRPELALANLRIAPAEALRRTGSLGRIERMTLGMLAGRPAYEVTDEFGSTAVVYADDGSRFAGTDADSALAVVRRSALFGSAQAPSYRDAVDMDQWTVSEVLDPHRPLHRVDLNDDAGTVVYVSDATGQIVRDTTARERYWNWLGSTIHWIYPHQLRRHRELWVDVVVYLSIAGIVSVVTGAILGFLRLRLRPRYPTGSVSPYRGMMLWHHVLGLVCLVFVATFIFSGLMSMTPWGIFDPTAPLAPQLARYTGGSLDSLDLPSVPPELAAVSGLRELEWQSIAAEVHLVAKRSSEERWPRIAGISQADATAELARRIERAAAAFLPEARIVAAASLDRYDNYYYTRHNRYRPLPVYRVRFDDAESSWYHIDLHSGALITRETDATRLGRWLFNGLHSLDFTWLTGLGRVWDVVVIVLCIAGFVFSLTAVVIGARRIF